MSAEIEPRNRMAQIHYRAVGNPPNTLPTAAISNCFPGLDYDFKAFWRRAFIGIVLLEWDNYVIDIESDEYTGLLHHRLLKVDGRPLVLSVSGPKIPGGPSGGLPTDSNPGLITMEWSNALALVQHRHGHIVKCHFSREPATSAVPVPADPTDMLEVDLTLRPIFLEDSVELNPELLRPGELTQGLCSPWQHDYRECSCYYWPASRPDYVNVEAGADGISHGDNWIAKRRTGEYILDDRKDSRLVTYEELFKGWEKELHFQVRGRDAEESK
jgi:hypothetical protein